MPIPHCSKQTRTQGGENVGGGIIKSLEACHEKRQLQHNEWEVVFDFPNSLKPNDAVPFTLTYTGNHDSKEDAMDAACLQALAHLLLRGPFQVLLSLFGVRACAFVFMCVRESVTCLCVSESFGKFRQVSESSPGIV